MHIRRAMSAPALRLGMAALLVLSLAACHRQRAETTVAPAKPVATAAAVATPAAGADAASGPAKPADEYVAAQPAADIAALGDAAAWGGRDCAPIGSLPGYEAGDAKRRDYEHQAFTVWDDRAADTRHDDDIAGRYCSVSYTPKQGGQAMSDLEIQSNYREQLDKLGARILSSDNRNTYALLQRRGVQTWIRIYSQETEIDVTVVDRIAFKPTLVAAGGEDHPLLGHMPNYQADGKPEKKNFDQLDFTVGDANDHRIVTVQGAKYMVRYVPKQGAQPNSDLDIQSNYRDALARLGAQILYTDGTNTHARLDHGGQTVWVRVFSQETEIDVSVIEEKAFQASIEQPRADALKAALDRDGHVALYIDFDFGKATLRPDAAPTIAQVSALLQANPALELSVEGNTDDIGGHDYNVRLSRERAAAVVAALVGNGIAAGRLQPAGNGPDKPVAGNDSAEGRARNRRVELVKR